MLELTTGVMFLMSSLYGYGENSSNAKLINTYVEKNKGGSYSETRTFTDSRQVQAYLSQEFFDTPILIEVARCESEFRQFDKNGEVIRGRAVADDIGVMQINEFFHGDTAKKLNLNIHTIEGNVAYAKYLYSKSGLKPWSASAPCWNKNGDIAMARK